jgi:hypothetical protein
MTMDILRKTLLIVSMPVFLQGCMIIRPATYEGSQYYVNPRADFSGIGRVVVFELEDLSNSAELGRNLTETLTESARKRHLFGVSSLFRSNPAWRSLDLNDSSSYSLEKLASIKEQLNTDAIIFGCITQHYPYPQMLTGLHLKMVDLRDGRLLWAIEQVWDSTDKSVERRMELFFEKQMRSGYEPMNWRLVVTSPRAFNKFVAYEVARTLPSSNTYMPLRSPSENNSGVTELPLIEEKRAKIPAETLKFGKKVATIEL